MKILVYGKKESRLLFCKAFKSAVEECDFVTISNFKDGAEIWSGDYLYNSHYDLGSDIDEKVILDIVQRDRSLSKLDYESARLYVVRYWHGVEHLFEQNFDAFMGSSVDMFTIDILQRIALIKKVPVIAPLGSFLEGYAWFTLHGERIDLGRIPDEAEVEKVYQELLKDSFLPLSERNSAKRQRFNMRYFFWRRKIIENIYNPLRLKITGDPVNPERIIRLFRGKKAKEFFPLNLDSYFDDFDSLKFDQSRTVYLPMHVVPEATTLYWTSDVPRLGYLRYLLELVDRSDKDVVFLIKEHPSMYGKRSVNFYTALKSRKNVYLLHPLCRSNEVLQRVTNVVVDTGSVGVESLLRGKRVLAISDSYYANLHPNWHRVNAVTKEALNVKLVDYDPRLFLSTLLSAFFPSDYRNAKHQDRCDFQALAYGIRLYLNQLNHND